MAIEKTFLAIKPDAVKRSETVAVVEMLEELLNDCDCVAMKFYTPSEELAKKHYEALSDKPFFPELIESFTSGAILGMVWQGENIVARARDAMGATNPEEAAEGSIRKKFGKHIGDNTIHGSDTEPGSASREVEIHFSGTDFAKIEKPSAKAKELSQASV